MVYTNMEEIDEMTMLSLGIGAASRYSRSNKNFRLQEVTGHKLKLGDQDHNGHMSKKLRLSEEQLTVLENMYEADSNLDQALKQGLAEKLKIKPRQVEVWFQNRRARTKHKQIEEECKNLKRWLEALNKENQKLKMELMRVSWPVLPPHSSTHNVSKVTVTCLSCNKSSYESSTV